MNYKMKNINIISNTNGTVDDAVSFLIKKHYSSPLLWAKFVDQYRLRDDAKNAGWRGEYWGKSMRSAVLLYMHSPSEDFYKILTDSARDMISVATDGRVSTYTVETEFNNWDMWCRKYVMLGLEYYLEICRDEALRCEIVDFLCICADYIIEHVGRGEGKIAITKTSAHWGAVNSSSILEPIVLLNKLTDNEKYLDFAAYIVENGGGDGVNVFELAYENRLAPYEYGTPKAYELMSCFEGLVEFALVTDSEKYKTAAINFARSLAATDVTIIGCCGITHELLDHSGARQTAYFDGVSQETCVTVTWMKLCAKMLCLTGESFFADCIEVSLYNAYLGALNVNDRICAYAHEKYVVRAGEKSIVDTVLPFDSYSPLIPGKRGRKIGGAQLLSDKSYFGCCACIGGAGVGVFLRNTVTEGDGYLALNFYFNGKRCVSYNGDLVEIEMKSAYPADGAMTIKVACKAPVTLRVRIPSFTENVKISAPYIFEGGYAAIRFENGDTVDICFDMPIFAHRPEKWGEDTVWYAEFYSGIICQKKLMQDEKDLNYIAFTRGPIVLAADSGMGKRADSVFELDEKSVEDAEITSSDEHSVVCRMKDKNGDTVTLVDYGSAGRDWETSIAAWLRIE